MRLALYARVFDAAHFFLPSIPMLHRSTLYMAGAAMPRGARLSLLRASLARIVDPESIWGLSGFPLKPLGKTQHCVPDVHIISAVAAFRHHNLWRAPSRRTGTLPVGTGCENPRFHPSLFAGGFELGYATNLFGYCRIRVSHPRGTWGPVTVSHSATPGTRSVRLHRSKQAMSCTRLYRADVKVLGLASRLGLTKCATSL